jgi:glucose/arabinose dehydrogenase
VIIVPFVDGRPAGGPEDVLTGFVDEGGHALGRPVGVAIDRALRLHARVDALAVVAVGR